MPAPSVPGLVGEQGLFSEAVSGCAPGVRVKIEPKSVVHVDTVLGPVVLLHVINDAGHGFKELFPRDLVVERLSFQISLAS